MGEHGDEPTTGWNDDESGAAREIIDAVVADDGVQDAAIDGAEGVIDALLTSGALDDVPFVRTLLGIGRGIASVRDQILERKLRAAIQGFGPATDQQREHWRAKLADEQDARVIGERLLYVIDAASSDLKADLVGRAFRAYTEGDCDGEALRLTVDMIHAAFAEDLSEWQSLGADGISDECYSRLARIGLVEGGPDVLTTESGNPIDSTHGRIIR
jgi:hypothetical protein